MSSAEPEFHFELNWKLTLVVLILLPTLIVLGFWQLQRAEEKRQILERFQHSRMQDAKAIDSLIQEDELDWSYRQVFLRGRFISGHYFLLDNRIFQGSFGYEIITPFQLSASQNIVLVNRGWVAGSLHREQLPVIEDLNKELQLHGEVYVPISMAFTLGEAELTDTWPKVIQSVDVSMMAKQLSGHHQSHKVFPYLIRLKPASTGAFDIEWPVVNVSPEKHTAYAFQWFTMALILVLMFVVMNSNLLAIYTARQSRN